MNLGLLMVSYLLIDPEYFTELTKFLNRLLWCVRVFWRMSILTSK